MVDIETEDLGVRVANIAPRQQQNKHSGFFITINTNFNPKQNEEHASECAEKLRKAVKAMLTEEERLKRIVKFLIPGDTWSTDTIKKVSSQFVIERGRHSKGSRIHSHAALHIEHRSKIRLDIPQMQKEILPFFEGGCTCNIKNLYINVKIIRVNQGIRNYLTKENL
jgi:hypothetical protein